MTTTIDTSADALATRLIDASNATFQVLAAAVGHRLGWYRTLAERGPTTAATLARTTHTDERYAREWLEHQVACGIVVLEPDGRFSLPPGHAEVLTDEMSLAYALPIALFAANQAQHLEEVVKAYRTGGGLSWADMGPGAREAQGAVNRPMYLRRLGREHLPSAPEVHERLSRPGARIADVGCGYGWSSIGLALAYPSATIDAVDVDAPSIQAARRNAIEAGVADRVRFHLARSTALETGTPYDVVFAFECIHDLSDPVSVLASMGRLAGEDGMVVVMDERTADALTGPADDFEQLLYGFSLFCCLPDCRSHAPSAATGTVLRPSTLRAYGAQAKLPRFDVLPIDDDFFRFYRLQ